MHLSSFIYAFLFEVALARNIGSSAIKRQDGTVDPSTAADCTFFDTALDASFNCDYFENSWGLTAADFLDWNPSVLADCSGIKVGYSYCVEVNNGQPRPTTSSTRTVSSTVTPTPTGNGISTPTPTQSGITTSCDAFYFVKSGDACATIASSNGITLQQFYDWNPAVGSTCGGLWADVYVCVSIIGVGSTTTSTTVVTTPTNGITTPQPTQTGMVSNCDAFYFVKSGDGCATIASSNGITLEKFYAWNPAVGSTCGGLWADVYVCVSIVGEGPITTTTSAVTSPTNGISTPQPIQTGMVSNCDAFYYVKTGDECGSIASSNGITLQQFYDWNPAVGSTCGGLWVDNYVCVSIVGVAPSTTTTSKATTTSAGNGVATPTPFQAGMTTNCKTFHWVAAGESCQVISTNAGITLANFYKWNPAAKTDCSGLWSDTYCCIGVL